MRVIKFVSFSVYLDFKIILWPEKLKIPDEVGSRGSLLGFLKKTCPAWPFCCRTYNQPLKEQSESKFTRPRFTEISHLPPLQLTNDIFKQDTVTFFTVHPDSLIRPSSQLI